MTTSRSSTKNNKVKGRVSVTIYADGNSTAPAKPSATTTTPSVSATRRKPASQRADDVLQLVMNRLADEKNRVFDSETSGLDWRHHHIVGYVVTFSPDPRDSYYVPFRHLGNANVGGRNGPPTKDGWDGKLAPGERELITALDKPGTTMCGHNMAFDLKFLSRVGFKFRPRVEDTMINEPLLDELVGRYSLEACCQRHKVQSKKSSEIKAHIRQLFPEVTKDEMGHYWRLAGDDRVAVEYACGDGTSTWQLRDAQMKELEAQELMRVWDVESRLIPVLARMMVRGIKVDEARLDWLLDERAKGSPAYKVVQLLNAFPPDFNERSPIDVRAWMERHGETGWPMTAPSKTFPNGQPSFTADWLEKSEAGKKIVDLRKLTNLRNSFILPLKERHLWNGRVHTTFNQLRGDEYGTVTGRLSSSEPNMQQVPKHDEELGRLFRSAFVPDFDWWGERDYSQIEPRLLAYYTRAKALLDAYRTDPNTDAHMAVSKAINAAKIASGEMDAAALKKYRNDIGKRINQTLVTGGGKGVLVSKYKVPADQVDKAWNDYFRAMPEIRPFQKRAAMRMRQRGYVIDLLGRRARLNDPNFDYRATNRLLQCGNASILKDKMVAVDDYLESESKGGKRPACEVLLNCHDALSFQFDESARRVYDHCKIIMEDFSSEQATIKLDLPIIVDQGEGRNWATASYGEE